MDQRRLFLFLTLCFLLMIAFGPKPKPPEKPDQDEVAQQLADGQGDAAGDAADEESEADEDDGENPEAEPLEETEADLAYVTLGSVDPDSPYRMAVTFTNQGAAVRRVELSSPRFRDIHDRSGYLGHLELQQADEGGVIVQAIVAGTPAAKAGIEVGDRIVSYSSKEGESAINSAEELREATSKLEPKQTITLQVARGDEAPADREVTLARRPLEVIRPEIENVRMRHELMDRPLDQPVNSPPSFLFTFEQLGQAKLPSGEELQRIADRALESGNQPPATAAEIAGISLQDGNWEIVDQDETSVTFRRRVPKFNVEVEKRYRLAKLPDEEQSNKSYPAYHLTLDTVVRNLGEEALPLRYRLDGPNGLPVEGWWYANKVGHEWTVGLRDVMARHVNNDDTQQIAASKIANGDAKTMQGNPLAFAGVDAQYFSAILIPQKPSLEETWIDELRSISLSPKPKARSNEGRFINITCRLISKSLNLEAGEELSHSYQIFAGPKRPDLLDQYNPNDSKVYGLNHLLTYGWFSTVSRAMLWILHLFYGLVGNYGIAIIMLTVLVRGCMVPLSRKQAQSMARMQELRPEMDKIKEKYKNDMQKQSQATQELYRKYNINPLAGCLPLFIQMPIFLGLYRALMVDVELRQAPLLSDSIRWCSNLAAPDMFYDWSWFMPSYVNNAEAFLVGLGPYLNVLPLVTAGLFWVQQQMMPKPTNEQAAMQMKVMKYMMLVMGLLFFKVASGLCIYFIASSLWAIAERKFLPKPEPPAALATATGPSPTGTPPRSTKSEAASRRRAKKAKKKKR